MKVRSLSKIQLLTSLYKSYNNHIWIIYRQVKCKSFFKADIKAKIKADS